MSSGGDSHYESFDGDKTPEKKKRRKARVPKKSSLRNGALHYLTRYGGTQASLERFLSRRIDRARRRLEKEEGEVFDAETLESWQVWSREIVEECIRFGYVNDKRWAEQKLKAFVRRGLSSRQIRSKLREKGVDASIIDEIMRGATDSDLISAYRIVRKKRLGAFRRGEADKQKELASLARRGFCYDVARRALQASEDEILEALSLA